MRMKAAPWPARRPCAMACRPPLHMAPGAVPAPACHCQSLACPNGHAACPARLVRGLRAAGPPARPDASAVAPAACGAGGPCAAALIQRRCGGVPAAAGAAAVPAGPGFRGRRIRDDRAAPAHAIAPHGAAAGPGDAAIIATGPRPVRGAAGFTACICGMPSAAFTVASGWVWSCCCTTRRRLPTRAAGYNAAPAKASVQQVSTCQPWG